METSEPTDADLVAATLLGHRESYGTLYDRYARLVRALFHSGGLPDNVVDDLTQECFLRAFRKLRSLREPDKFGSWISGMARRMTRETRRSLVRDRHQSVDPDDEPISPETDFTEGIQEQEELSLMRQHLAQLPEDQRLAIHAFFLEEQSAPQAARLLNLSRSGFYGVLQRALARLTTLHERQCSQEEQR